ncbi:MAG: peptidyl-prolyl cis-trans isomerase [Verrucomicrobiales bacterium]|nr:peptidyl-prolyl cis-trans isomerase [Verrucomicrobiales bacterium]
MKRLIREPLVHFLLLGAALFAVYAALNKDKAASREDIVVTTGQIENLAASFAKVWQRPPTAAELKAQIDQYVKEEIFSREAMKLGLDQNDTVIRRRLQQKMEFIAEDFSAATEPTEAELADYLAKHPGQFAQEQRFTFRQVFLNPQKRGDQLEAEAATLLARLKQDGATADVSTLSDSLLLPQEFADEPQRAVAAQFGSEFAVALAKVKPGEWSGPIQSGYGTHLVLVTARMEGRVAALEEVREQVKRELMNARRLEANQKFLESLLAKYRVTVQSPKAEAKSEAKTTAMNR